MTELEHVPVTVATDWCLPGVGLGFGQTRLAHMGERRGCDDGATIGRRCPDGPPNVNAALTDAAPGPGGRRFRPPNSEFSRATARPALPGVDLPTQLPEPQPTPEAGLAAHKPGAARCALWDSSTSSAGGQRRARQHRRPSNRLVVRPWVPVAAVVTLAGLADDRLGMLAQFIAALVVPVLLTGPLAAPDTRGRDQRAVCRCVRHWPRPSPARGSPSAQSVMVLLAAPAILAGLTLAGLPRWPCRPC